MLIIKSWQKLLDKELSQPYLRSYILIKQALFKGRFIGQNVRLLNDIIEYADAKKLPGILLFIDFRKAFDTIEWNFYSQVY